MKYFVIAFCIAFLVAGIALAGNNGGILIGGSPRQIASAPPPSGTVACDIGPNAPSVPAPATLSGLTTCAVNADFTQNPAGPSDANGINFGNPATFINACGATTTWRWYLTYFAGPELPCSGHAAVVTDTGVTPNTQALQLTYSLADQANCASWNGGHQCGAANNPWSVLSFVFPQYFGLRTSGSLPIEHYLEFTVRIPQATEATYPGNTNVWGVYDLGSQSSSIGLSPLQSEWRGTGNSSPGNSVAGGWGMGSQNGNQFEGTCTSAGLGVCGNNGPVYGGWDSYHTWGYLVTSDESTIFTLCAYRDGTLQGCEYVQPNGAGGGPPDYTDKSRTIDIILGNNVDPLDCSGNGCMVNGGPAYLTSWRLWECSGYKTGTCPGTIID